MNSRQPVPPRSTWQVNPLTLTPMLREVWLAGQYDGFLAGLASGEYAAGVREGWRQRVEHEHLAWQGMARTVRAMGGPLSLSFDELQARRRALPDGYRPRPVPTYAECMASWQTQAHRGAA